MSASFASCAGRGAAVALLMLFACSSGLVCAKEADGLPLQPHRSIRFTTDEATWMSLDVTPDGKSIVFDLLGDLYSVPITGDRATPITQGMAYDSQPRVSPDGKWIAFISDRGGSADLWIKAMDGDELRQLTFTAPNTASDRPVAKAPSRPEWSPDSHHVLVRSADSHKLTLHDIDGRAGLTLDVGLNAEAAPGAVFDPTGRFLYGVKGRQIVRCDLQTGELTAVTSREIGSEAASPVVSRSGEWLVYLSPDSVSRDVAIHALSLRTHEDKVISHTDMKWRTGSSTLIDRMPGYALTPDSKFVIIATKGKIQRIDLHSGQSAIVPFSADVALGIGPELKFRSALPQGPVEPRIVQDPRLSPDGKQLTFSVLTKIYTMKLPGGAPKRLTQSDAWEFKPVWSPDGKWIAYVTWSMEGGQIWRTRSDGKGQPQRLTHRAAYYTNLNYSPDGHYIVGVRDAANGRQRNPVFDLFEPLNDPGMTPIDVICIPATGGDSRVVTTVPSMTFPHFADDPQRIYLFAPNVPSDFYNAKNHSRTGRLISMRLDGSDQRTHLNIINLGEKDLYFDNTAQISPDARWALVKSREQLYVIEVASVGVQGPEVDVTAPAFPGQRLTDIGADYFSWGDGGKSITWAIGSTFYKRPLASVDFSLPAQRRDVDVVARDQDPSVQAFPVAMSLPRATPHGTLALRHATALTMDSNEVIEDADIIVKDNRITAIARSGQAPIPTDATQIDLHGKFVMPGLVDTHAHWSNLRRYNVLEPQSWDLMINLAYGVTTGLDVQTSSYDTFVYEDLADTGQTLAPRLLTTGPGVVLGGEPFHSYEETLQYLKRYRDHYHTHYIKAYEPGPRRQSEWMVMAAKELGLRVAVHPGIERAIDGFTSHEHAVPLKPVHKDVVELFARAQIGLTPTLIVGRIGDYFDEINLAKDPKYTHFTPPSFISINANYIGRLTDWQRDEIKQGAIDTANIQRAGGIVGVGSHGNWPGIQYHMEMWAMASGMTPREVLHAATMSGAQLLGLQNELGSLTPGKLADLLILDKNPLDNIRNSTSIRFVMRNGELYAGDTLDQVWPVRKPAPSFWWQ
jgi:Tol biopolymer transport system component